MSALEFRPNSFCTSTSTQSPWQSNPFCHQHRLPVMAWYRRKASL